MVRSYGFRLPRSICYYLRGNTSSLVRGNTSSLFCGSSLQGSYRNYGTSLFNNSRVLNSYFSNVASERDLLKIGLLKANFGVAHSIHSLAHLSRDYYDLLGVSKNATPSEIKKAYYGLVKKLHPNTNEDDPEAEKNSQEVQKANEVPINEEKHQQYDQLGHEDSEGFGPAFGPAFGPGFGPGFGPEFDPGFGPRFGPGFGPEFDNPEFGTGFGPGFDRSGDDFFRRFMGGEDVKVTLELSSVEAVLGCAKTLTIQTDLACDTCGGTGDPPGTRPEMCKQCIGRGMVFSQKGEVTIHSTCPNCGGAGKFASEFCKSCRGKRVVRGAKTVKLNVMPGVDTNEIIKLRGSGGADPEGDEPGHLYVIIKVREDPLLRREGSDIHVDAETMPRSSL